MCVVGENKQNHHLRDIVWMYWQILRTDKIKYTSLRRISILRLELKIERFNVKVALLVAFLTLFYLCIYTAPAEQTLEHADDVEQLKKLRQLGGEGM